LQLGDNAAVDGIEIMFWHIKAFWGMKKADWRSDQYRRSLQGHARGPAGRLSRLPVSATLKK
jgi:hypothetical protein